MNKSYFPFHAPFSVQNLKHINIILHYSVRFRHSTVAYCAILSHIMLQSQWKCWCTTCSYIALEHGLVTLPIGSLVVPFWDYLLGFYI